MTNRFCIFGAGAVGSFIAAALLEQGKVLTLVGRGAHADTVNSRGLTAVLGDTTITWPTNIHVSSAVHVPHDVLLVTLKATAVADALPEIQRLAANGSTVVFAQNGLPVWKDTPNARKKNFGFPETVTVICALCYSANEIVSPGTVVNRSKRNFLKIEGTPDLPYAKALQDLFRGSRIDIETAEDIAAATWEKLVINMTGSIIALLTERRSSISNETPALQPIFDAAYNEALAIAHSAGVDTSKFLSAEDQRLRLNNHFPSILQDHRSGKSTELREILGQPLKVARANGVPTPVLDVIHALAQAKTGD